MAAVTCKSSSQGLGLILLASAWDQSISFFVYVNYAELDQKDDLYFPNSIYTSKRSELQINLCFSCWQFFKRSVYGLILAGAKRARPQEISEKSDENVWIYLLQCLSSVLPLCANCSSVWFFSYYKFSYYKWVFFSCIKNI